MLLLISIELVKFKILDLRSQPVDRRFTAPFSLVIGPKSGQPPLAKGPRARQCFVTRATIHQHTTAVSAGAAPD